MQEVKPLSSYPCLNTPSFQPDEYTACTLEEFLIFDDEMGSFRETSTHDMYER